MLVWYRDNEHDLDMNAFPWLSEFSSDKSGEKTSQETKSLGKEGWQTQSLFFSVAAGQKTGCPGAS